MENFDELKLQPGEYNSQKEICEEEFHNEEQALDFIYSFPELGGITEIESGSELFIAKEEEVKARRFFESITSNAFFDITMREYKSGKFAVLIRKTNKHCMVTAAMTGNLDQFISCFQDTDKMKRFTLELAIQHENLNIVEYMASREKAELDYAVWYSIRYDNLDVLKHLISLKYTLPDNWLAYCLYNNSINSLKFLCEVKSFHKGNAALKSDWLKKEVYKNNPTVQYFNLKRMINDLD